MTVGVDELQRVAAFTGLPDDEIAWLAEQLVVCELERGEIYFRQGGAADRLEIVLAGRIELVRREGDQQLGSFFLEAGEVTGRLPFSRMRSYGGTAYVRDPARIAEFPAERFTELHTHAPQLLERLVNQMLDRTREFTRLGAQRDKLISLGTMAAGLAHELNNPASAARRAAGTLIESLQRFDELSSRLLAPTLFPDHDPAGPDPFAPIYAVHERGAPQLSPLDLGEREDDLAEWLDELGLDEPWEAAAVLAAAGYERDLLERFSTTLYPNKVPAFAAWLHRDTEMRQLSALLDGSTRRMSELVGAMKAYSYMDQATDKQLLDLHRGIDDTIALLEHKLRRKGIALDRDYGDLPQVPGFGGDLNQVWTNLLANAVEAVGEGGRIVVRSRWDPDTATARVEVEDDGPGIPDEIRARIFEPFFTTKGVGEGTGLGLDIANRVVSKLHAGTLAVASRPGRTVFTVRLPAAMASGGGVGT